VLSDPDKLFARRLTDRPVRCQEIDEFFGFHMPPDSCVSLNSLQCTDGGWKSQEKPGRSLRRPVGRERIAVGVREARMSVIR